MGRARYFDLGNAAYLADLVEAGGSLVTLGQIYAPKLGVPDLKVTHTAPRGEETRLFVESESFDATGCCDMRNAKPWPEATELLQGIAGAGPAPQGGPQ